MVEIEQVLRRQALPGGVLLRGLPAAYSGRDEHLVRQVMALANADLEGPRWLVFGVEHGAAGAMAVIGLSRPDEAWLARQVQVCMEAIEPRLDLEIVTTRIADAPVAALVIKSCGDPPYVAGDAAPAPLRAGECWLFDAQGMRLATRSDLDALYATRRQRLQDTVLVGLGDDPRCDDLEIQLPDAANPPSRIAALQLRSAIAATRAATATIGREDTALARLAHARIFGAETPYRRQGMDTLVRSLKAVPEEYRDADLHYRFETRAVRLNLCIMNARSTALTDVLIEVALPAVPGLAVATRTHPAPGAAAVADEPYPEVIAGADAVRVRSSLARLAPGARSAAFPSPLRIAVDGSMAGRKIAIRYALTAAELAAPACGRLRARFRR